jgi:hypothetical protein
MTLTVDTAILTVVISAAVSFGIFGLKEKWVEPRRWKRSTEAVKLEKKLEVYGTLTTLLQSFYHKGQRVDLKKGTQTMDPQYQHSLELPFDADKLDEIFEKSRYLISEDLITKYMEYIEKDTARVIFKARKEVGSGVVMVNLTDMQSAAEREFADLQGKYKELVKFPA